MTPLEFRALVHSVVPDKKQAATILAAEPEVAAWWIERTFRGERYTVAGEPVHEPGGAA